MKNSAALFMAAGVLLLGGLFYVFRPVKTAPDAVMPAPTPDAAGAPTTAGAPTAAGAPGDAATPPTASAKVPRHEVELVVKGSKLASGPDVIKASEGDEVVIRITTDKADDLHLHGYDLHAQLKPGEPTELKFTANRTGRFEYELHKAHVDLGVLEVHPK